MAKTSVQLEKDLLNKVKKIMQKKKPLRKINTYAEATREVLFDFINKNKKILEEDSIQNQNIATATEEIS